MEITIPRQRNRIDQQQPIIQRHKLASVDKYAGNVL